MRRMHVIITATLLALGGALALATEAQAQTPDPKRPFDLYPDVATTPGPRGNEVFMLAQMGGMHEQMHSGHGSEGQEQHSEKAMEHMQAMKQQMREQIQKICETDDPEERERLLQEHMNSMEKMMGMMHDRDKGH